MTLLSAAVLLRDRGSNGYCVTAVGDCQEPGGWSWFSRVLVGYVFLAQWPWLGLEWLDGSQSAGIKVHDSTSGLADRRVCGGCQEGGPFWLTGSCAAVRCPVVSTAANGPMLPMGPWFECSTCRWCLHCHWLNMYYRSITNVMPCGEACTAASQ